MKKNFLVVIFFLVALGIYLAMMSGGICADDSAELCGVAATLGIAHSPGYPLFALIGRIFNFLFPFASSAYRTNLVAVILAVAAQTIIFQALLAYSREAAIFAGSFLVTNYFLINISTVTEVYGVVIFLTALIIQQILICFQEKFLNLKRVVLVVYLWALAIVGHYIAFFLFPVIVYLLWRTGKESRKVLALALFFAFIAFSVLFYIYLRAQKDPIFSWEDPKTLKRFFGVIARWRYGWLNLAQGRGAVLSVAVIREKLKFFFRLLQTANGSAAFLIGLFLIFICLFTKNIYRREFNLFFGGFLFSGLGFLLSANVSIGRYSSELLSRFFFLPELLLAVSLGLGAGLIARIRWLGIIFPVLIILSGAGNISLDNRQDFIYYDYARNILATLPPNTILLSDRADEMEFSLAYLLRIARKRLEVSFIDCNAGVTKSIYGDDYYYIWGEKRLQIRTKVEKELLKESLRPVYYATFFPKMIPLERYPSGLVFATKPTKGFDWSEIYIYRYPKKNLDFRHQALNTSYFQLLLDDALARKSFAAAEVFSQGLLAYGGKSETLLSVAWRFFSAGDDKRAEKYFLLALKEKIQPAVAANNLGVIYKQRGNKPVAYNYYQKAIALDSNYAQAYYNLAVLAWEENNWEEVVKNLEKVVMLEPENNLARKYLQEALLRLRK